MFSGVVLNPEVVRFETLVFEDVVSVEVDRVGTRVAEEWTDAGVHAGFVDVAELRTSVRVTRRLGTESVAGPVVGALGVLTFYTSATWGDGSGGGRRRVRVRGVITAVKNSIGAGGKASASAEQEITIVAASVDGASDPVSVDEPGVGE